MLATVAEQFARTAPLTGLAAAGPGVLEAMARVPRLRFVPAESAHRAFDDAALSLPCGQSISQPFVVALMTSLLHPEPGHRVLEIGAGSGYQAAVLGELVQEVHTIELVPDLARSAADQLRSLGYDNVHVHAADGTEGWPEHAPYDGILVACGPESLPPALVEQLAPGGRLVIPVGPHDEQRLLQVTKDASGATLTKDLLPVRFVPFVHPFATRHRRIDGARGIDLQVVVATEALAFAELALAMSALVAEPTQVRAERRVEFACSAANTQLLLSRWLDEVAWAMRIQGLVFTSFDVRLRSGSLRATGLGERVDPQRHQAATHPTGVMVHAPKIERHPNGWCARCTVS